MLCELCRKIRLPHKSFKKKHKGTTRFDEHQCIYRHHKTYDDLLKSAYLGCELCNLFRPFIEHAQFEEAGLVENAESDCPDSDKGSDITREDPFLSESEDDLSDEGDESEDDDEEEDNGSADDIENASMGSQASSGGGSVKKPHEVLEWLFLTSSNLTGPEQLWLTAETDEREQEDQTRSSGSLLTLTLSAGSIDHIHLDQDDSDYCLDGKYIGSRQSLAVEVPGLWRWHRRWLNICTGRKPPQRSLRPIFEYFQNRDNVITFDPEVTGRNVVEKIDSKAGFKLLQKWYDTCLFQHKGCPSLSLVIPPVLPTRIIDVGPAEHPPKPLLDTTQTPNRTGRYAILSHCWGPDSSNISKTCLATLEDMRNGMSMSTLSKNFADAIRVAHAMKLRYVWIDALCIMQDSPEDLAIESAQMAQYYKNADVMLSGLASPHANHRLLRPRASDCNAARISLSQGDVYLRPQLYDTVSIVSDRSYSYIRPYVSYMPLHTRAWTVQERVFSSRIIHFSEQQLVWQCKTCAVSEDGQYTWNPKKASKGKLVDLLNLEIKGNKAHAQALISSARTGWHDLLAEYTSRHLTFSSDKLPALSGLAREVAQLTEDKYLAGLWVRRLREELLWTRQQNDGEPGWIVPERIRNGSPSWSWASLTGKVSSEVVKYRRIPQEWDPKIIKMYAKPATSDPFGRVSSANIIISIMCHDYVGPTTFTERPNAAPSFRSRSMAGREDIAEDAATDADEDDDNGAEYYDETIQPVTLDLCEPNYDFTLTPHLIACFGLYDSDGGSTDPTWADPKNKYSHQEFMLLKRVLNVAGTVYSRVGVASTMDGQIRRLKITKEQGWTRKTIVLV